MGVSAPSADDLAAARRRLEGRVHRTPVHTSRTLDDLLGCRVVLKCENLQKVGAFKARGATNAVESLDGTAAARGVLTHSSGNHAQALAFAARARGIPCWVVMPHDAPAVKRAAVEGYGATVIPCAPTVADREATAARVQAETQATFVHPYDDMRVIAGQASAAAELLEQAPELAAIYVPVGGGGLASGTCLAVAAAGHRAQVVGAEPAGADDAARSLEAGRLVTLAELPGGRADTVADGLRTSLSPRTFAILGAHLARIERVPDAATLAWMRFLGERLKLVVEPSGAVPLAALAGAAAQHAGTTVGVILSGGNVALPWPSGA
jgi:threonine dehydratase